MNIKQKYLTITFCLSSCLASAQASAYTIDLGLAGQFNAFILGDMTGSNSDVEGRLAVGGNLLLNDYAIGMTLTNSQGNRDDLIVGGDLTIRNARIYNGNARSGGAANLDETVGFYNEEDLNRNNGSYIAGNPLDFAAISQDLIAKSTAWAGWADNGTTVNQDQWGNIKLTGTNSGLNIFSVTSFQLANTASFWLDIPETSTALVNIAGSDVTMSNFAFFRTVNGEQHQVVDNGQDRDLTQAVLFNLFGATSLNLNAIGIEGSLLAPLANTTFSNGQINGNLILGSILALNNGEYTGQVNNVPFISYQVPIPPVSWMLLIPLIWSMVTNRQRPTGLTL